jgi:hypothetical protein
MTETVLEKLGSTESTTLVFKCEDDGKIRVGSLLWETPKVILPGEVLESVMPAARSTSPEDPSSRRMRPADGLMGRVTVATTR